MAVQLVTLLKDEKLRQRMGEAGLARVRATFTVERMVEEIAAVYAELAGRRRAADTVNLSADG
jgi:glycosyltransferase involved in cell wall biosynthesis